MFDFLLCNILTPIEEKAEKALVQTEEKFDHDTTILKLLQLGVIAWALKFRNKLMLPVVAELTLCGKVELLFLV
jgi:hypothetical protein